MDTKYYLSGENEVCNEATTKQSLLRRSFRNKEMSSASSIYPSMSISIGENSVVSQFSAFSRLNEIDRLVSDQGLITPKIQPNASRRKIRDKSYYKGVLRLKSKEIFDEIRKMQKEITLLSVEQQMYIPYKKKAESKATDLQKLQKTLAEYNLLDDMLQRDMQLDEAKKELQELITANKMENAKLEKQFAVAGQKERKIKEIETNISQENDVSEILTTTMNSEICEKLKKLRRMDYGLQILREEQEEELVKLKKERDKLENQCIQNEGLEIIKKLWSSEKKRNEFQLGNNFPSSEEEYEYLQNYEIECNILFKGLIQEHQNVASKIQNTVEELNKLKNKSDNPHSDRSVTFSKLKKQEKTIDEFFSHCSDEQHELLTKQQEQENIIVQLLEKISNKINSFDSDLQEGENDSGIAEKKMEYVRVFKEWEECNNTESNILKQLQDYKIQIMNFENKISEVSNIEKAKENSKVKKMKLLKELNEVKEQKRVWKHILSDLKNRNDSLQYALDHNETYIMLSKLEKQWHLLEKENFAMENFIASKDLRKELLLLKNNVRQLRLEINNML